jgi:hypothetical protein
MDTTESYSACQRNKILIHAMARMNLEEITLNEISHTQKDEYYIFPLI